MNITDKINGHTLLLSKSEQAARQINLKELEKKVPEIVEYYKKQTLISIKSKGIKKDTGEKKKK